MLNKGCRGSTNTPTVMATSTLLPTRVQHAHVCKHTSNTAAGLSAAVTRKNWFEVSNLLKIHMLEAAAEAADQLVLMSTTIEPKGRIKVSIQSLNLCFFKFQLYNSQSTLQTACVLLLYVSLLFIFLTCVLNLSLL